MKRCRAQIAYISFGALVVLAIGYGIGDWITSAHYQALFASFNPVRERDASQYPLIAPLLSYTSPEATEFGDYTNLAGQIQSEIVAATSTGEATRVSVYFRDLNTNQWVGINQDDDYYPASLLKVPLMIAWFKEAENDPAVLDQTIVYQTFDTGDAFDAPSTLTPGKSYTVEQLIEAMIEQSDNGATFSLLANVDSDTLSDVYANLGIQNPGNNSAAYQISTRSYALFFRVLYNSTYLDQEYSEKAMNLLSQATFVQGLVAGVPNGTMIAHKFGEHVLNQGSTVTGVELHDCGVVYYPDHPYLLCVMTSATDVPTASSIIKDISQTVYNAVEVKYSTPTTSP